MSLDEAFHDTIADTPTDLYRYYDVTGRLLYVGVSKSVMVRAAQHARTSSWWSDWVTMRRETFPTRDAALAAETRAIVEEEPAHNVIHNVQPLFGRR